MSYVAPTTKNQPGDAITVHVIWVLLTVKLAHQSAALLAFFREIA